MKTIRTLLVVVVLAAFSFPVFAEEPVTTNPAVKSVPIQQKKSVRVKTKHRSGILQSIDLDGRSLTVKNRRGEESFTILPDARVTRGRKRILQGDLGEGMKVTIAYEEVNGEKIARSVRVAKD
jgi:hypothetical protein